MQKVRDERRPVPRRVSFRMSNSGSVVINFVIGAMVLFGISGLSVDYAMHRRAQSALQAATDAGALAAAKEMGMVNAKTESVIAVVNNVVQSFVGVHLSDKNGSNGLVVDATVNTEPLEVNVVAMQKFNPLFGIVHVGDVISAHSVARIVGKPNVCVLGLDPSAVGTISLEQQARVTGNDCAVFSNSSHHLAIRAKNSASLEASMICSVGGKDGGPGNFTPEPLTDCPSFDDPLADRPEPSPAACKATNLVVSGSMTTLTPGTYCGGLSVKLGADVELSPGIYIFKNGPLLVSGGGILKGENVGLFFTGTGAVANFAAASTIKLSAPEDGLMAGLLIFESRSQPTTGVHKITSDDARTLLGTIYLPRSELRIDASSPVADQSAYTAIVARKMRLYGGPHLVLNTNYGATTIPVPQGIKGTAQPIALVE